MVLTNLGDAAGNKMACSINESWRIGIAQKVGKSKISKALKCGSALLAQRIVTKYNSILAQLRYWLNDMSRRCRHNFVS